MPEGPGFGLNLMTDCYINYGLGATIFAAVLLGLWHRGVLRYACVRVRGQIMFAGLVAAYPIAIRSGIPGFKGMLMGMILGFILSFFAHERTRRIVIAEQEYNPSRPRQLNA